MEPKDIADLFIEGVGKIEFYWNFYTVTLLAMIGWLVTAKNAMAIRIKWFVTIGFAAFVGMNLLGLWGAYAFTEALRTDLLAIAEPKLSATHEVLSGKNFLSQRTCGLVIHLVIDAFAIYAIWKARIGDSDSPEKPNAEQGVAPNA